MQSLPELLAAEAEVAREWQWLHEALNEIARVRAEQGDAQAFRLMQAQAMRVGQRRIELSIRIAEIEGPAGGRQGRERKAEAGTETAARSRLTTGDRH